MKKPVELIICLFLGNFLSAQDSILYPVYFHYKVSQLDTNEEKRLKILVQNFQEFNIERILIQAYCDERGGKRINDTLSKFRAFSIYKNIKSNLKKSDSNALISAKGYGSLPLDGKNNIEEQRSKNRKGDITIYYSKKPTKEEEVVVKKQQQKALKAAPIPKLGVFFDSAKKGDKVELKILFVGGLSRILPQSQRELDSLYERMNSSKYKINIIGHIFAYGVSSDIDGYDEEYQNNFLSRNRAQTVYNYLVKRGIDPKRMKYEGMGGKFPSGISAERDRRVEIQITDIE
ncbi:MAG: OmpA family protein [Chitinophagales bacterium]